MRWERKTPRRDARGLAGPARTPRNCGTRQAARSGCGSRRALDAEQQLVEIARAVGANAKVLILDEPTASLSHADTANLFRVIRELKAQGVGMIYISHRLEELPTIADRVTVLRDGRTIDTRSMSSVTTSELIHRMVGRSLSSVFPKRAVELGPTILELRQLGCSSAGSHIADVRAGEIPGSASLVPAGPSSRCRLRSLRRIG